MRCCSCMREYPDIYEVCPHCGYIRDGQESGLYYLPPGMILADRYEIGVQINAGGFGIIYKAWDRIFNKVVAIKEYYPGSIATRTPGTTEVLVYSEKNKGEFEKGKSRFLNEARTVAKFNSHPNISDVYAFFEENNTAYMVMDYMDGMSYRDYINAQGGKVEINTAVRVTIAVLDALREVHKSKVIHRDINPSNIFILSDGVVKLIDFGAAKIEDMEAVPILTPHYAAPEQYQENSKQGPYTDFYALGATLYYAVTGVKPEESIDRVLEDKLPEPSQINPDIPEYLNAAIMRAMAVREDLRFQNTLQFRDAIMNKGPVLNVEAVLKRRKLLRAASVSAVFLALTVIAGICIFVMNQRRENMFLSAVGLDVWIPAAEGQTPEDAEKEFESMISEFRETYPKVEVTVTAMAKEDYEKSLSEAAESDALPVLFDSTALDPSYYSKLDSLEEPYKLLNTDQFFYLADYKNYFPGMKQMPLCFQIPILYATSIDGALEMPKIFQSYDDLKVNGAYSYSMNALDFRLYEEMTDENCIAMFKEAADESARNFLTDGYEMFTDQAVSYYLSDTSDYQRMLDDVPGQFQVIFTGDAAQKGRFDHLFSVALNESGKKRKAAKRLIYYLLSENAQDVLCVQNAEGLPLNKKMCEEYAGINQQDFSDIQSYVSEVTFQGGEQSLSYRDYMKKWEN